MRPTPTIDPGEPLIHRQPHTPGPDPVWALDYSPPNASAYSQDGSDGGSSAESTAGAAYGDGSGPR